ncbi:tyrosine-protein phosphatase [Shewanella olleyana]|uniref:phosphatase domain-containing protein n=1 Tax=Shewanella olleyana TaxID=135626 RepID=UPI00200E901C|nr:tyrosine-protein phosphatase [Shewanella olleyana]MCL1065789.1 tyrosine-protein phosphatase [Shewanella olleyana]
MSLHPFDALTLENGAKLIFTPCPGTKEASLSDSVATLKQAGTDMLLTLMFDKEMAANNAGSLPSVCADNDITWVQLPILDDAAPNEIFEAAWAEHKAAILSIITSKGTIAVHCKGGTGRTGLVIGLMLLAHGWPADKVISEVQKIRPKALKNPVQLAYFNSYR